MLAPRAPVDHLEEVPVPGVWTRGIPGRENEAPISLVAVPTGAAAYPNVEANFLVNTQKHPGVQPNA